MFYEKTDKLYDPKKEVIKLNIRVNEKSFPNFPNELYVSEFNMERAIQKLMGLDYSLKDKLNLSEEEYNRTWIAWGVVVHHTTNPNAFGINEDTLRFTWR